MASGSSSTSYEISSKKKLYSSIWNFFDRIEFNLENDKKNIKAKCKICDKLFTCGSNAGTSHLRRHHESCKIKNNVYINYMQLDRDESEILKTFSYNESYCREAMIDYIIRAEQPFNMMETHDFSETIQRTLNPQFTGWSRDVVIRYVMEKFNTQKEIFKKFFANFEGTICLTTDIWTSLTHTGFLCITAHYIDSTWKLNKRIVSFKIINTPHNGKNIAALIDDEITNLGIRDKIFTITSNNDSNNNAAVHRLKQYWQVKEHHTKLFHVYCCAHKLNLIINDGLKHVESTLQKIRDIAYNINSSQSKYELFLNCCKMSNMKRKNINLDISTRWNSTYKLLQNITNYKKVVQLYEMQLTSNDPDSDGDSNVLNDYDWHIANLLRDLFEILYTSINIFCGVYHPTSNQVIIQITNIYIVLQKYLSFNIYNDTIFAMIENFKKYWGEIPLIFYIALVVDPRLKFEALDEWLKIIYFNDQIKIEEIKNEIDSLLYNLYIYYKEKYDNDSNSVKSLTIFTNPLPYYKGALEILKSKKKTHSSSSSNTSDLDRYLGVDVISFEDYEDFDILIWWKSQQYMYPVLSILARDVLTIPVSTIASEAAFSTDGRMVCKNRCDLPPKVVEADICLRDWKFADERMHDFVREENMLTDLESLKLSRSSWMQHDSLPSSPENID